MILKTVNALHTREALEYLTQSRLFEVRLLRGSRAPLVGYFESVSKLTQYPTENAYFTIHEIHEGLICRAINQFLEGIKATSYEDVVRPRWLLIDIDPRRPSGIPASEQERAAAWEQMLAAVRLLKTMFTAERLPALLDTGNGYHLFYPLEGVSKTTLQRFYKHLKTVLVSTEQVVYDINPSVMLSRLPGTMNRKGFEYKDRVHRPVQLLRMHSGPALTEQDLLSLLPASEPAQITKRELPITPKSLPTPTNEKLTRILTHLNAIKPHSTDIHIVQTKQSGERTYYLLSECAFAHHGQPGHATLIEEPNGFIRYHCFSSECRERLLHERTKNPAFPLPLDNDLENRV